MEPSNIISSIQLEFTVQWDDIITLAGNNVHVEVVEQKSSWHEQSGIKLGLLKAIL